jgi:hypothetical protein
MLKNDLTTSDRSPAKFKKRDTIVTNDGLLKSVNIKDSDKTKESNYSL